MTIETKFNIHDKVWTVYSGKASELEIIAITYEIRWDDFGERDRTTLLYHLQAELAEQPVYPEAHCFSTREELIQSL